MSISDLIDCYASIGRARASGNTVDFESLVEKGLLAVLMPNSVGIDIGAHEGRHAIPMAKAVGPSGHIYAFEPLPEMRDTLARRLQQNSLSSVVTVFPYALSNYSGMDGFVKTEGDLGYSGLKERTYNPEKHVIPVSITVEVRQLDDIVLNCRCDCIKIDIEGGEYHALLGAKNTIAEHRPAVFFEFGCGSFSAYNIKEEDMYSFFNNLGYVLFDIAGNELPSMTEFETAVRTPGLWDYVALPSECNSAGAVIAGLKKAFADMVNSGKK